ncbi:MAG: PSD1 and planctomycete cytochrome C domain-containing protein [Gemmataceae bacterium]
MNRITALLLFFSVGTASAAEPVSFSRDIRSILTGTCFKCHGPDLKKGGLDLQTLESAMEETNSGSPAVVPGKHAASEVIRRVKLPIDDPEHMPPKTTLTPKQIETLSLWIDQGAKYEEHWAYLPPRKVKLPVASGRAVHPIDAIVDRKLAEEKLSRAPEASRTTLIRRVSLDLTGLPPTPKEVEAFLADRSPQAYEKLVDRLLASPHYGEQMGRLWLDLARYADTNGYEKDDRRTIWPYRDWVIQAFNRDMPFDQFTQEQLAGDLIPGATQSQIIATGFHRNTMVNTEGGTDEEEFRTAAVVDRVNTTMEVWMGLTFSCAQCHNHKYDPVSQKDFYQLFAIFNSTADKGRELTPEMPVPTEEDKAIIKKIGAERKQLNAAAALVPQSVVQSKFQQFKKQEDRIGLRKTLIMKELPKPRETHIMLRGEFRNLGDKVEPGTPAKFTAKGSKGKTRLDLAKWLVSPENPLTGRVMTNRLWAKLFGRGIVETLEDFGVQGEPPTDQALLDWLAVEFAEQGWSFKKIMKFIVMSETYRQSSATTPEKIESDPFNRFFSRGPRFRLDAEMVRDQALTASGLLNRTIGGPSVMPFQPDGVWANPYSGDRWTTATNGNQYRRGLYTFWRRTAPYAMFTVFDAPSREVTCLKRARTNTPLQALATLNDKGLIECANALARRMMTEGGSSLNEQIDFAFQCCTARKPTAAERDAVAALIERNRWHYAFHPQAGKKLAQAAGPISSGIPEFELAARTVAVNILLNLDETLTKE